MLSSSRMFACISAGDSAQVHNLLKDEPGLAMARNDQGLSALLFAQYHRRAEIVRMLVAEGIELTVFEACAVGDFRRVETLLACDPLQARSFSVDGFTPLHLAAFFGHPAIVTLLLQTGADCNAVARNSSEVQPLHSGVAGRNGDVVERLLRAGAHHDAQQRGGFTPLQAALESNDERIIELVRQYDPLWAT